jgi:hypothetical protein
MVLKSSASASDADRIAKIASVVAEHFTRPGFCRFFSPHGNDKVICASRRHGDKPGIVVAKIPAKPHKKWCELRKIVFSWTHPKFPFRVRSGRKLTISEPRIITVTGKAFFDINHAPADQSNRRTDLQGYAAWEIHPVMKIETLR